MLALPFPCSFVVLFSSFLFFPPLTTLRRHSPVHLSYHLPFFYSSAPLLHLCCFSFCSFLVPTTRRQPSDPPPSFFFFSTHNSSPTLRPPPSVPPFFFFLRSGSGLVVRAATSLQSVRSLTSSSIGPIGVWVGGYLAGAWSWLPRGYVWSPSISQANLPPPNKQKLT